MILVKAKGKELTKATSTPIRTYENTFVFKKDDPSLKELFDKEISQMMENGEIEGLVAKYKGDLNG